MDRPPTTVKSTSIEAPDTEWLVNQIAHTLRNPIFAAMVQAEALTLRSGSEGPIAKAANMVHRQLKRLENDLNEMLLYGRPPMINRRQMDIVGEAEKTAQRFRDGEFGDDAAVATSAKESPLDVELDPTAVKIILERLITNAVQHTDPPHSIRVEVMREDDDRVRLAVHDQGRGVQDNVRDQIFQPFFPQHSGRPGLGLAVAAKFAHAMGGSIEIDSELGKGTIASCVLPTSPPNEST